MPKRPRPRLDTVPGVLQEYGLVPDRRPDDCRRRDAEGCPPGSVVADAQGRRTCRSCGLVHGYEQDHDVAAWMAPGRTQDRDTGTRDADADVGRGVDHLELFRPDDPAHLLNPLSTRVVDHGAASSAARHRYQVRTADDGHERTCREGLRVLRQGAQATRVYDTHWRRIQALWLRYCTSLRAAREHVARCRQLLEDCADAEDRRGLFADMRRDAEAARATEPQGQAVRAWEEVRQACYTARRRSPQHELLLEYLLDAPRRTFVRRERALAAEAQRLDALPQPLTSADDDRRRTVQDLKARSRAQWHRWRRVRSTQGAVLTGQHSDLAGRECPAVLLHVLEREACPYDAGDVAAACETDEATVRAALTRLRARLQLDPPDVYTRVWGAAARALRVVHGPDEATRARLQDAALALFHRHTRWVAGQDAAYQDPVASHPEVAGVALVYMVTQAADDEAWARQRNAVYARGRSQARRAGLKHDWERPATKPFQRRRRRGRRRYTTDFNAWAARDAAALGLQPAPTAAAAAPASPPSVSSGTSVWSPPARAPLAPWREASLRPDTDVGPFHALLPARFSRDVWHQLATWWRREGWGVAAAVVASGET